jgi:uncharacterized protein (DUF2237 family)
MPAHNRLTIPVSLSQPAKPSIRKKRVRQSWNTFLRPVFRWRGARWARRKLATVPAAVRIAFVVATILAVVSLANVVYLAAFIHLCGAGPARGFVRRGFQVMAGERCGDHLVTTYLAKVNAMKRQFLRLAVNNRN